MLEKPHDTSTLETEGAANTPVTLSLGKVTRARELTSPDFGASVAIVISECLGRMLGDSSFTDGAQTPPKSVALEVHILDVATGCHIVRSSFLAALVGFGNARLRIRAGLVDVENDQLLSTFSFSLKHNGLDRGEEDYLVDNGPRLLSELSYRAATQLVARATRTLCPDNSIENLNKQPSNPSRRATYAYEDNQYRR